MTLLSSPRHNTSNLAPLLQPTIHSTYSSPLLPFFQENDLVFLPLKASPLTVSLTHRVLLLQGSHYILRGCTSQWLRARLWNNSGWIQILDSNPSSTTSLCDLEQVYGNHMQNEINKNSTLTIITLLVLLCSSLTGHPVSTWILSGVVFPRFNLRITHLLYIALYFQSLLVFLKLFLQVQFASRSIGVLY